METYFSGQDEGNSPHSTSCLNQQQNLGKLYETFFMGKAHLYRNEIWIQNYYTDTNENRCPRQVLMRMWGTTSLTLLWECKTAPPFGKHFGRFFKFKDLSTIRCHHFTPQPLPNINKSKCCTRTCTWMLMASSFVIAQMGNNWSFNHFFSIKSKENNLVNVKRQNWNYEL